MILTFKVRHNNDFSIEFAKARQIVEFGLGQRKLGVFLTSKHVKHFGLKSLISNQLLRKYCKNIKTKSIKYIKLPICGQGIKFKNDVISIPCLKLSFKFHPHKTIELVKSIEIGDTYYYIACEIKCQDQIGENLEKYIGVDLNSTGHCAVVANPSTGKILKLGKNCNHIRNKYFNIRRKLQKLGKYKVIKTLGMRVTTLRPVHGFAAEASAATIIEVASFLGIPVSTTHCISASIMGVGATRRLSAVRWGLAGNIVAAWVITFPVCGGLGHLFSWLLGYVF